MLPGPTGSPCACPRSIKQCLQMLRGISPEGRLAIDASNVVMTSLLKALQLLHLPPKVFIDQHDPTKQTFYRVMISDGCHAIQPPHTTHSSFHHCQSSCSVVEVPSLSECGLDFQLLNILPIMFKLPAASGCDNTCSCNKFATRCLFLQTAVKYIYLRHSKGISHLGNIHSSRHC